MKKYILLGAVAVFSLGFFFNSQEHQLCQGIVDPELAKNYVAPPNAQSNVDEEMFDHILDRVYEVYAPIFEKEYGSTFVIQRKWDDPTMNAYAMRSGSNWIIAMFGGFARHPKGSAGHFLATACHEVGHHIGGAPKKGTRWASDEGQSDYYATLKCIRKLLEGWDLGERYEVHPLAQEACGKAYDNNYDIDLCEQGAMMGHDLATVLGTFSSTDVSFETPSTVKRSTTLSSHPPAQCRHDIYFHGALCAMDYKSELPQDDPRVGACWVDRGQSDGTRRRCWFQPTDWNAAQL